MDLATALTYAGCLEYCGAGQQPFSWAYFSQEYSTWLLPYLALLSQLPFGSRRRADDVMSMLLTVGSPMLAGYSLYMTFLNARWVNDQLFAGIDYPSGAVAQSVVRVSSSLQQVPLRIHPGKSGQFESLVVHPDNDNWWSMLAAELDYTHTWSVASATSITWVILAYLLSVADSLSNVASLLGTDGQTTVSLWIWLIAIVIGWLVLSPKSDYNRVHAAYRKANKHAFVADPSDGETAPTQVTSNFGLTISSCPPWELYDRNITSPDESRIPPVFNYARTLSWSRSAYITSLFYRTAWEKSNNRVGVNGNPIPGIVGSDVPRVSRLGTRDQIIHYCRTMDPGVDDIWPPGIFFNMFVASIMALLLQWGTTTAAFLASWFTPTIGLGCRSLAYLIYGALSTVVWFFLVSSSILGYYAHCCINDPPTPDLERNGLRRTLPSEYSQAANHSPSAGITEVADIAVPSRETQPPEVDTEEDPGKSARVTTTKHIYSRRKHVRTIALVADCLRWTGKALAILNAVGILSSTIFQYASVYDNCYCNSSVLTWGFDAFNVMSASSEDIASVTIAWTSTLALSLGSCVVFVLTIFLMKDSLPSFS